MPFVYDASVSASDQGTLNAALNNLEATPEGKIVVDLINASPINYTITVDNTVPFSFLSAANNPLSAGTLNINVNELVNGRFFELSNQTVLARYTLEDLILHEALHIIGSECTPSGPVGHLRANP